MNIINIDIFENFCKELKYKSYTNMILSPSNCIICKCNLTIKELEEGFYFGENKSIYEYNDDELDKCMKEHYITICKKCKNDNESDLYQKYVKNYLINFVNIEICKKKEETNIVYYYDKNHINELYNEIILYYETFEVPNEIKDEITQERIETYHENIIELNEYYLYIFQNNEKDFFQRFENIFNWSLFTDLIEYQFVYEQEVGLIIKGKYPYPVGYIHITDCNDFYIDILYDSYEEYKKEYLEWKNKPIEKNLEEMKECYKNEKDKKLKELREREIKSSLASTFVEYILIKKELIEV